MSKLIRGTSMDWIVRYNGGLCAMDERDFRFDTDAVKHLESIRCSTKNAGRDDCGRYALATTHSGKTFHVYADWSARLIEEN